MFGLQPTIHTNRTNSNVQNKQELIAYILTPRSFEPTNETALRLQERSAHAGFRMGFTETDVGHSGNPYRMGLWRVFRRLICRHCEPKRMPMTMINFDDFMHQALQPCSCKSTQGFDGIVVARLDHLSSDRLRSSAIVTTMAKMGKHLIAEDGICLSCCHPAMKKMLQSPR